MASKFSSIAFLASFPTYDVACNSESDGNAPVGRGPKGYGDLANAALWYAALWSYVPSLPV